jgi:lipid-A-disaccharide synthase
MPSLFLIAGEPSGDVIGAGLIRALKAKTGGAVRVSGVGGPRMEAEGLRSLFPMEDISVMGFREILGHIPLLRRRIRETVRAVREARPDMLVTIDSPGFCFRVAKALAEEKGLLKWHYVAPSVWAYKPERVHKVKALFDAQLLILPFEAPYFDEIGMESCYVGHPVVETEREMRELLPSLPDFRGKHGLAPESRLLTVMAGSRKGEIERLLPVFLDAAERVHARFPCHVLLPVLPHLAAAVTEHVRRRPSLPPATVLTEGPDKHAARMYADMCVLKSGTVSLEQALYDAPALVAHRVHPLSAALLRRMIRIPYASLANIMENDAVLPELLQERCTAENIAAEALSFLASPEKAETQRRRMREVLARLRPEDGLPPSEKAAETILTALARKGLNPT